jgi:hypothetical protein
MFSLTKLLLALSAATAVSGHAGMSNFYVNGVDQGDAVCVRMNPDPDTWDNPIENLSGSEMACGFSGTQGVGRVCAVPDGATMTFEWREAADAPGGGVIDPSHLGPCAVYMKKVDSAISDPAIGDGWFKIWDDGYDESTGDWCTLKLINNGGYLSVSLPPGLVGGYYLVRPELLALHEAEVGDPQYYIGCAQIFLESTGNLVPEATVAIPGEVSISDRSDSFNIYNEPMALPYPLPGPPVAALSGTGTTTQTEQTEGQEPADCICESGSNFCGTEVPSYSGEGPCYQSSQDCWDQATDCYNTAPPTGDEFCRAWESKCDAIQANCEIGGSGPPNAGVSLNPPAKVLNPVPVPLGPTVVGGSTVAVATGTPAAAPAPAAPSLPAGGSSNSAPAPAAYQAAAGTPAAAPQQDKQVDQQPAAGSVPASQPTAAPAAPAAPAAQSQAPDEEPAPSCYAPPSGTNTAHAAKETGEHRHHKHHRKFRGGVHTAA